VAHGLMLASRWARERVLGAPPPIKPFEFRYWFSPLLALIFLAYLIYLVLSDRYGQVRTQPALSVDRDAPNRPVPSYEAGSVKRDVSADGFRLL